jgi:hypothetical protein
MIHDLFYDEKNEIIILKFNNHFLYKDVEPIISEAKELLNNKTIRQVLIETNKNYNIENRETREAIADELTKLNITDIAFVGVGATERMIARVLIKTIFKLNGDFFKDKNEAINWLKSKR